MRLIIAGAAIGGLVLSGCSHTAPTLPADPLDRAATCSAIQLASEQQAVGAGQLSAEAQERVLHVALLAGASDQGFDRERGNAVINRTATVFDQATKGKWQTLKPACVADYPPLAQAHPTLPNKPFERDLQCYALTDFMRKALGQLGGRYAEASLALGIQADKLDGRIATEIKKQGLVGDKLQARKGQALADAARLGQPPAVLAACKAAQPPR